MNVICKKVSDLNNKTVIEEMGELYNIKFPSMMVSFFEKNNGGIPMKKEFFSNGEEYEIRCFLSFNEEEYTSIRKPLDFFQKETNGKVIPFAKDSADNYFCINLQTEKIYFWDKDDNLYYNISNNFEEFISNLK